MARITDGRVMSPSKSVRGGILLIIESGALYAVSQVRSQCYPSYADRLNDEFYKQIIILILYYTHPDALSVMLNIEVPLIVSVFSDSANQ